MNAAAAPIDPVELEINWSRLVSLMDEADAAFRRTSFSTLVRESGDLSCVVFDEKGRALAQGSFSQPSFTGTAFSPGLRNFRM